MVIAIDARLAVTFITFVVCATTRSRINDPPFRLQPNGRRSLGARAPPQRLGAGTVTVVGSLLPGAIGQDGLDLAHDRIKASWRSR